jgi:hypothetical protein
MKKVDTKLETPEQLLEKFDISRDILKKLIVFEELIHEHKACAQIVNDAVHIYSVP